MQRSECQPCHENCELQTLLADYWWIDGLSLAIFNVNFIALCRRLACCRAEGFLLNRFCEGMGSVRTRTPRLKYHCDSTFAAYVVSLVQEIRVTLSVVRFRDALQSGTESRIAFVEWGDPQQRKGFWYLHVTMNADIGLITYLRQSCNPENRIWDELYGVSRNEKVVYLSWDWIIHYPLQGLFAECVYLIESCAKLIGF
jgi:hypothetical protein